MRNCKVCGIQIPEGRIKILPNTVTCVEHSETSKFAINIVSQGDPEKGDLNQEVEIIRDPKTVEELNYYKKQQGTYF